MSASTPTRCRDVESLYRPLQLSNNHEPSSEQAAVDHPHASLAHPSKSPEQHQALSEAELQHLSQEYHQLPLSSSPYGLRIPSTKVAAEPENNIASRHPHALDLSASLKLTLAQRFYRSDNHERDDNQSQTLHQEETENKEEDAIECAEPHIDDDADGSGNQTHHNDSEVVDGTADGSSDVESDQESDTRRSCPCEPMIHYDEFLSVSKPSPKISRGFFATASAQKPNKQAASAKPGSRICVSDARFQDCDDDIVNICSPVTSSRSKVTFATLDTLDEPSGVWKKDKVRDPKWTPRQFGQYYELLGFLEHSFTATDAPEVAISSAQLNQMERLLSSLLPSRCTTGGVAPPNLTQLVDASERPTNV